MWFDCLRLAGIADILVVEGGEAMFVMGLLDVLEARYKGMFVKMDILAMKEVPPIVVTGLPGFLVRWGDLFAVFWLG